MNATKILWGQVLLVGTVVLAFIWAARNGPKLDQWKTTIGWGLPEKDTIPARLIGIIEAIEQTCRPVIQQIGQ
jgi:hypothetical protein